MRTKLTKKQIHLLIIGIGMIFTLLSLFHTNIWFDESYSVSLATHSFSEIWRIDSHDVHPVLYYQLLHCLFLMFGENIQVYRLFSWACLSMMGIFGYTGIRKDYGEDCGLWFSFFVFFFPVNVVYAGEIRMYMLVSLLILLGTFYAIRIAKGQKNIWNHIRMVLFFVLAAYTHYYGLLAAAVVNLILLVILILHWKEKTWKDFAAWLADGVLQIALYIPWIFVFLAQTGNVKTNFWIQWIWPKSLIEILLFQVSGNLEKETYVPVILAVLFEASITAYLIVNACHKKHQHGYITLFTLGTYFGVIAIAVGAGFAMHRIIIYSRYLLVCTSLLFLYFAYNFATFGKKMLNAVFCVAIMICSICANLSLIDINYDASNQAPYEYLNANMQEGDAILVGNYNQDPNSFIAVAKYMNHPLYYWNEMYWMDESVKAYQAYGTGMRVVYDLKDIEGLSGRVWVIYADDDHVGHAVNHVYDAALQAFHATGSGTQYFQTKYKSIEYTIGLITV
jgi:Predicted membrane protein